MVVSGLLKSLQEAPGPQALRGGRWGLMMDRSIVLVHRSGSGASTSLGGRGRLRSGGYRAPHGTGS